MNDCCLNVVRCELILDDLTNLAKQDIINKVKGSDIIIVSMLIRISMDKGLSTIHETHNELLKQLNKLGIPMIGISFGSPYLPQYDIIDSYLCSYGYGSISLNATTLASPFNSNTIPAQLICQKYSDQTLL